MSMSNYSFQFYNFATLKTESIKQTVKNANHFTMHLTTFFNTLSLVDHILKDEHKMVSAIEKNVER